MSPAPLVPSVRPVVVAVRDLLASATGRPAGAGEPPLPLPGEAHVVVPYYVVRSAGGVRLDGPPLSAARNADGYVPVRVSCVGDKDDMAEWAADQARRVLLTSVIPIPHYSVMEREHIGNSEPMAEGQLVTQVEEFGLWITPTS